MLKPFLTRERFPSPDSTPRSFLSLDRFPCIHLCILYYKPLVRITPNIQLKCS